MSRRLKAIMTDALRARYEGVDEACVVDMTGLNVADTVQMRRSLLSKNMRVMVVKNSMARRAFEDGPLDLIGKDLDGPCALVTGGGSVIEVAREIVRLAKNHPQIGLKTALLAGESGLISIQEMAALKGHDELIGEVAMLISSPGWALTGCLSSPQSKIAGCMKVLAEREEEDKEG